MLYTVLWPFADLWSDRGATDNMSRAAQAAKAVFFFRMQTQSALIGTLSNAASSSQGGTLLSNAASISLNRYSYVECSFKQPQAVLCRMQPQATKAALFFRMQPQAASCGSVCSLRPCRHDLRNHHAKVRRRGATQQFHHLLGFFDDCFTGALSLWPRECSRSGDFADLTKHHIVNLCEIVEPPALTLLQFKNSQTQGSKASICRTRLARTVFAFTSGCHRNFNSPAVSEFTIARSSDLNTGE